MAKALRSIPGTLRGKDVSMSSEDDAAVEEYAIRSDKRDMLIIQCPSCQARFALAPAVLEGINQPRFHCSRCDHIFNREEFSGAAVKDQKQEPFGARSETEPEEMFALEPGVDEAEAEVEAEVETEETDSWTTGWNSYSEPAHRGLEIPRLFGSRVTAEAPHENTPNEEVDVRQMTMDFGLREPRTGFSFHFGHTNKTAEPEAPTFHSSELPSYRGPLPVRDELPPELLPSRGTPQWRALAMFIAPVAILLIMLIGTSFYLRSNPVYSSSLSTRYFPSAPQIAPAGLLIRDLKFRNSSLENGERVHVISGIVENQTDQSFKELTLEGVAFDKNGKQVMSQRVDAGSTLVRSKIRSFTSDMIQELQSRKPARRFQLEPGAKHEFSIVLIGDQMQDARYYSARIYSVR